MAFISISDLLIQVGKPIIKTLWDLTKDNFDDHESRIAGVEQGATKVEAWNSLTRVRGNAASLTGLSVFRAPADMQLIEARVNIFEIGGSTGILEYDVKRSDADALDFALANSVFTTKPSIDMGTASDFDQSTNAVFDINEQTLAKDDQLRLDITSLPVNMTVFQIFLLGELD